MIKRDRAGLPYWPRPSTSGERLYLDTFATRMWRRNRGNRWRAAKEARAELSELGFGVIEIIQIVYYLLKIWKMIREHFGLEASVDEREVSKLMRERGDD